VVELNVAVVGDSVLVVDAVAVVVDTAPDVLIVLTRLERP
jgi:hypothetical protein